MGGFIGHDELARDRRFSRQDNATATVLSTLPDDVDTVVEVFEKFDGMIAQAVKGTAAPAPVFPSKSSQARPIRKLGRRACAWPP